MFRILSSFILVTVVNLLTLGAGFHIRCRFIVAKWDGFDSLHTCEVLNNVKTNETVVDGIEILLMSDEHTARRGTNKDPEYDEDSHDGSTQWQTTLLNNRNGQNNDILGFTVKNLEWNYIPSNVSSFFPNIKIFQIINSNLKAINRKNFQGIYGIVEMNLAKNSLSEINENTLEDLTSLEIIYLTKNKLKTIHENSFAKLINLRILHLDWNKIESLSRNLFKSNLKLEILFLANNKLNHVAFGILLGHENLKFADFSNNECINHTMYKRGDLDKLTNKLLSCDDVAKALEVWRNDLSLREKSVAQCKSKLSVCEQKCSSKSIDLQSNKNALDMWIFKILFGDWR